MPEQPLTFNNPNGATDTNPNWSRSELDQFTVEAIMEAAKGAR